MNFNDIPRFETHSHSMFSNVRLLDSINRPEDLILTASKLGLSGICLTDHEILSGTVQWLEFEKDFKKKGKIPEDFKCGVGNEIYLVDTRKNGQDYYHCILLAKDAIGFRQLCELSSKSWYQCYMDRGMMRVPTLKQELAQVIKKNPGHVIMTSACIGGELGKTFLALNEAKRIGDDEKAQKCRDGIKDYINFGKELFGDDFYLEIAPGLNKDQLAFNKAAVKMGEFYGVKLIYGTDAHYLTKEHRYAHKAYLTQKDDEEREVDTFYEYAHLMDNEEAYSYLKESGITEEKFEELCNNSIEIKNKIEGYDIFRDPIIPHCEVKYYEATVPAALPEKYDILKALFLSNKEQERYWINQCWEGLNEKNLLTEKYLDRLQIEADIINTIGGKLGNCLFEYFNTMQSFIQVFWDCGSIVGPGRGSSVCFLSNYLLGITQLDPVEWNLAEWRFLNKDRVELPDVDIDIAPSKRPAILRKIREKYGELRVLQVATFGTSAPRASIQAAARGYRSEDYPNGIDPDESKYISSLIPTERGVTWTIDEMLYGNEEKDRKPNETFIEKMNEYPGLLEIVQGIEGIVDKNSQHASGVIIYNKDPWETGAIMRSPDGSLTTQFSLHDAEKLGDTKYDFLITEICDKMINCLNLLMDNGYFKGYSSIKEIYDDYLYPSKIDLNDQRMWDALGSGKIVDLFQFDTDVGGQAIRSIKPRTPLQLMMANALTRLTGEKGKERPIDRYVRMKDNIQLWYDECKNYGLTEEEIKVIEPYYLPAYGTPTTQEKLMLLCMDENIGHFTLKEANAARKICAKKKMSEIPALEEKFLNACPRRVFGEYVWQTAILPQMSYAFAEPHALAYSYIAIQILKLCVDKPVIYWNCACLITNSGSDDFNNDQEEVIEEIVSLYEEEDTDEYEYEDLPDRSGKKKKKVKTPDYGKVATAIGNFKTRGIEVTPPDINESKYTFTPDEKKNMIALGLRNITRISTDLAKRIIAGRPYESVEDFFERIKVNKVQALNLIKSGCFDSLNPDREEVLKDFVWKRAEPKTNLTLANMPTLIKYNMLDEECDEYVKLYSYNKYIRKSLSADKKTIKLLPKAMEYFCNHYDPDILVSEDEIDAKAWEKFYKKEIAPLSEYIKESKDSLLAELNQKLFDEEYEACTGGNVSHQEMEAMSFYYHDHELKDIDEYTYDLTDFSQLDENPEVEKTYTSKQGDEIVIYKLHHICGTVLDRNKIKNTVTILTPHGVVTVKIWKNQFAKYDKQISERGTDGKKHVMEKSWFSRGTLLYLQGIRRGESFVPKSYKDSRHHCPIMKITSVDGANINYVDKRYDEN